MFSWKQASPRSPLRTGSFSAFYLYASWYIPQSSKFPLTIELFKWLQVKVEQPISFTSLSLLSFFSFFIEQESRFNKSSEILFLVTVEVRSYSWILK